MVLSIMCEFFFIELNVIYILMEFGVKGLIVFFIEDEKYNELLLCLLFDKFLCVFIDCYLCNIEIYIIIFDNYGGVYKVVFYLLFKSY